MMIVRFCVWIVIALKKQRLKIVSSWRSSSISNVGIPISSTDVFLPVDFDALTFLQFSQRKHTVWSRQFSMKKYSASISGIKINPRSFSKHVGLPKSTEKWSDRSANRSFSEIEENCTFYWKFVSISDSDVSSLHERSNFYSSWKSNGRRRTRKKRTTRNLHEFRLLLLDKFRKTANDRQRDSAHRQHGVNFLRSLNRRKILGVFCWWKIFGFQDISTMVESLTSSSQIFASFGNQSMVDSSMMNRRNPTTMRLSVTANAKRIYDEVRGNFRFSIRPKSLFRSRRWW